jgi:hypothetical protein
MIPPQKDPTAEILALANKEVLVIKVSFTSSTFTMPSKSIPLLESF